MPVPPHQAADMAHIAGTVQPPRLSVHHQPRRERPGFGMGVGRIERAAQPTGLGERIGIE